IYTHMVTDHNHYFEDGGATYHNRFNSFDFIRGQESDPWVAMVKPPVERFREMYHEAQFGGARSRQRIQGMLNESRFKADSDFPVFKCFDSALEFLDTNGHEDNWFLQVECFDPHEPFCAPESFRTEFPTNYAGPIYTWPQYRKSTADTPDEIAEIRANYGALVTFCDQQLGRLLDWLDREDLWDEISIVLTTDHGFMLGEHDWWGKNRMPFFNEIAHIPLMIHDATMPESWGTAVSALTQVTDLPSTLLDLHGVAACTDSIGRSMLPLLRCKAVSIRDIALYGIFGGAINATDGRHSYFLYDDGMEQRALYEYTLMPMHTASLFEPRELADAELYRGFSFTKGAPVLRAPALSDAKRPPLQGGAFDETTTCLYDLQDDPGQASPFRDDRIEAGFREKMIREMNRQEAPAEVFHRFGLA
ncbi:MAG: sulfatase, partial [Rhodobacteraceae bacterium]|nr:sulfatase [Paracoccaceae bacterium]